MSAKINHIPSLSVGIPAYNEAANIGRLLREIVAQEESGFSLLEILVLSDGSTDGTKAEVEAVTDPRIKFTDSRQRLGKSGRVNQILQRGRGDIILLLDADITLRNSRFISEAVAGFDPEVHGLSGFNTTPVPGRTFVERSLNSSIRIVETVRRHWNNGLNFLGYRGSGIMLTKTLARSLKLPENLVTDDAFYFFSALAAGYTPRYRPDLRIYYGYTNGFTSEHEIVRIAGSGAERARSSRKGTWYVEHPTNRVRLGGEGERSRDIRREAGF